MSSFRERVYTGNWPETGLLNSLLESEGIQTVVVDAVGPRRGGPREIYVINEAQIEGARRIVEHFLAGTPLVDPKSHRSWRCRHCNELVEGQFTECWKCGAARAT